MSINVAVNAGVLTPKHYERGRLMFTNYDTSKEWRGGVFLCRTDNSFQADLLESKLRSEGIPCMKKYLGGSNAIEILMGRNDAFPIDLYVPAVCLADAQNVIVPVAIDDDFEDFE